MSLDRHVYAFGYNGFNQISRLTSTNLCDGDRRNETHQLKHPDTVVINDDETVSRAKKGDVPIVECCITWSQIWWVTDDGRLQICGYNEKELTESLEGTALQDACVRVLANDIILCSSNACWVLPDGDTTLCKLAASKNEWKHIDTTEKCVIAVNEAGLIHEGCLRDNHGNWSLTFTPVDTTFKVSSVACGFEHVLVLTEQGAVYSFGAGSRGQLGHGEVTVDPVSRPARVDTLDCVLVTSVAAGGWHSIAVTGDGDIYLWGWNESGQLGLPNGKHDTSLPGTEDKGRDTISGIQESCPVGTEAEDAKVTQEKRKCVFPVYVWRHPPKTENGDSNESGSRSRSAGDEIPLELHQQVDTVQVQTVPYGLDIPDDMRVRKVACGSRHTCVLFDTGHLMTAGWNGYGQLCHGDTRSRGYLATVDQFVENNETVTGVVANYWNTIVYTETNK